MNISYRDAFLATHQSIREGGMQWIGANISQGNLFLEAFTRGYLGVFNLLEGEQAMMDCQKVSASMPGFLRGLEVSRTCRCWSKVGDYLSHCIRQLYFCSGKHSRSMGATYGEYAGYASFDTGAGLCVLP